MPNNTYDRYVTWGIQIPEGVAVPSLDRWGMPVYFPDPDTFFPKNVVRMYAIRSHTTGTATTTDGNTVSAPAGIWFTYTEGSGYSMVADAYFTGGIPDLSGGTEYPSEADRDIDPSPPQWAQDGTLPPGQDPATDEENET